MNHSTGWYKCCLFRGYAILFYMRSCLAEKLMHVNINFHGRHKGVAKAQLKLDSLPLKFMPRQNLLNHTTLIEFKK